MALSSDLLALFTVGVLVYHLVKWLISRPRLPLPPGPPGYPIIGNILDVPSTFQWIAYHDWSRQYRTLHEFDFSFVKIFTMSFLESDIVYANMAGTSIVVINSIDAANDLLQKRSTIYSSR